MKLKKGKLVMEVSTDVQASAFLRAGYELVAEKTKVEKPTVAEKPKRSYRKKENSKAE